MGSLSYSKEAEIIQAFNSTLRYLDDIFLILTIRTLKPWWVESIHLNYSKKKIMRLIPKP